MLLTIEFSFQGKTVLSRHATWFGSPVKAWNRRGTPAVLENLDSHVSDAAHANRWHGWATCPGLPTKSNLSEPGEFPMQRLEWLCILR